MQEPSDAVLWICKSIKFDMIETSKYAHTSLYFVNYSLSTMICALLRLRGEFEPELELK